MPTILTKENIKKLSPHQVWEEFYMLTKIPHPTWHEEKVIEYIKSVAASCNLSYKLDDHMNLMVDIPATPNHEHAPTLLLQGHTDMVPNKDSDKVHDFTKDPLTIMEDNGFVHADHTTLGADNGIGVAYMLALMKDHQNLQHGHIKCLFTASEEQDPQVKFLDPQWLKDVDLLINIDTEEEDMFVVGSASAIYYTGHLNFQRKTLDSSVNLDIQISGLPGGHSGLESTGGHFSAIRSLITLLDLLRSDVYGHPLPLYLVDFQAHHPNNLIAPNAHCTIALKEKDVANFETKFKKLKDQIFTENQNFSDFKTISMDYKKSDSTNIPIEKATSDQLLNFFLLIPQGPINLSFVVQNADNFIKGYDHTLPKVHAWLADTSSNIGSLELKEKTGTIKLLARTNSYTQGETLLHQILAVSDMYHITYDVQKDMPVWTYEGYTPLIENSVKVFKNHGINPKLFLIHAGLEVSMILEKGLSIDKKMESLSIGPTIPGAHTPKESVNIESVSKIWDILLDIIKGISTNKA